MRRLAVAGVALALGVLPFTAHAQTASFEQSQCGKQVTVTGGLSVSGVSDGSNTVAYCIANFPKYSGKWYFEFTVTRQTNNGLLTFGPGIGNNGLAQPVQGGLPLSVTGGVTPQGGADINAFLMLIGGANTTAAQRYPNTTIGSSMAVGQTAAIAVNLDTNAPQIWFTSNVNGTGGYNGGPLWNNSATSSPELPGTGNPTTGGTGFPFAITGQGYFPVFTDSTFQSYIGGAGTFDFGASPFVGTVPAGYQAWNVTGGGPSIPGPQNPLTINVANAPAWQPTTTYVRGDRVLAGPAWNGSAYTNGQPLYLWALTGGSGGTSGSSPAAFSSCPSPSNYGGGLLGNTPHQWLSASKVKDGALTWTCLTPVDYTTLTAAAIDTPSAWTASTAYLPQSFASVGANVYMATVGGTGCTSGQTALSGTSFTAAITGDGTCSWLYQGSVPYTSTTHRLPHELIYQAGSKEEVQIDFNTTINLWYGGRAAPAYVDGTAGEAEPMIMRAHYDYTAEFTPNCKGAMGVLGIDTCNGIGTPWITTLRAAPGDSFANNMTPGVTPFGYPNPAYGVTIKSNSPFGNTPTTGASGLALSDSGVHLLGLQIFSKNGPAVFAVSPGTSLYGAGSGHGNAEVFDRDIFYSGGSPAALTCDALCTLQNSTVTYAGNTPKCIGSWSKFSMAYVNDTIIGPGSAVPGCTAFGSSSATNIGIKPWPFYNDAIFGFTNEIFYAATASFTVIGDHNMVSFPAGYTPPADAAGLNGGDPGGSIYRMGLIPGITASGLDAADAFINPAPGPSMNLTTKPGSSLIGGGATFSAVVNGSGILTLTPSPDIYGNARPQGTRYDVGAYQRSVGCASPTGTGCH